MSKFLFGSRKRRAASLASVLALLLAGAGLAAWIVLSTGDGRAPNIATLQAPTVSPGATPTEDLYPGDTGDLTFSIDNPNGATLLLTNVEQVGFPTGTEASGQPFLTDCPVGALTLDVGLLTGLSVPVPPGVSEVSLSDAVVLDVNAATECQGATDILFPVEATFATGG